VRLEGTSEAKKLAKRLRSAMLLPEVVLWNALRRNAIGHRFRRQHAAGNYISDFYCHAAALIIEVDGEAHERGDAPERDARRDAWFEAQGLFVLRVTARDVLADLDAVVRLIKAECDARAPSVSLRSPPPPGGEELDERDDTPPPRGEVARRAGGGR
jgi:very-short-patch-repair endonuclease